VRELDGALRSRKLKVWLDERELLPGQRWIPELERILETTRTVAVCVGESGFGPWEEPEMEAALSEYVRRRLPVIPVLLPNAPADLKLPLLLKGFIWVDLRNGMNEERLDRLVRGIKGPKRIGKQKRPPKPASPKIHNLPLFPIGDLLKGRDEDLRRLEASLEGQSQATAIIQTLHGLGGIGKTRLAVEYAYRSGDRYEAALFVTAESPEALRSGLANLARPSLLAIPEYEAKAEAETVDAVLCWLRDNTRWLLILDNVDTEEAARAVREILPQLQRGHVLITARRKDWPVGIRKQPLGTLSLDEATQFLLDRTQGERASAKDDTSQARHLAEILDGLPLALEQAAAYIVHHQASFASYLLDWGRERENVLGWHDENLMQYPASAATTWQTTFRQLTSKATAVLRLTSFLAPDPIPITMFEAGASIVERAVQLFREEVGGLEVAPTPIRDAFSELAAYSMVTRESETLIVHRIVQEVVAAQIPAERRKDWLEQSLRLVNDFSPVPPDDVRTWPVWDLLRSHVARVVDKANEAGIHHPTARLMSELALLLVAKGLYAEAEPRMTTAVRILDESGTPEDTGLATALAAALATALDNLAQLLMETNRSGEAEPMMRRALKIDEASLGTRHPKVAIRLSNLAQLLRNTDRLAEAEPMMRRALEIDEEALGETHPNIAIRLNNLAGLLRAKNRQLEAEPMLRRALWIDEAFFGAQHPNVAIGLNNLAHLLGETDRLGEAEPMMRRALEIIERSLGPNHPNTQAISKNLATLLNEVASKSKSP
jgi:tetratricopeptide (TPR) repeat protein